MSSLPIVDSISEYILTIYHHNEDFKYFNTYYIPQLKNLITNLPDNVNLRIYIFTSVDLSDTSNIDELVGKGNTELIDTELHNQIDKIDNYYKIDCNHVNNFLRINNFIVKIIVKTYNIDGININFVNILPYEYELLKLIFPPNEPITNILDSNFENIKNEVNWNNNSIGAKRFISQSFVINLSNKFTEKKFFHWQSDLYIMIGIPSYAKNYNNDNPIFVQKCNHDHPTVSEIAKFLYDPPSSIDTKTNTDLGDIIVRNDNSELYTFFLAHYEYREFIDHFTLGQQDIQLTIKEKTKKGKDIEKNLSSKCFKAEAEENKDNKEFVIKGLGSKSTSPYKPKFSSDKLTINTHYDKFYITNINSIKLTHTYYNPLFTDWSEDIFFTNLMQKRYLVIIPFYLLTYSIPKKKIGNFTIQGDKKKFEHITFKIFGAIYSPSDSTKEELNIKFTKTEDYQKECKDDNTKISSNTNRNVSLVYKTDSSIYNKKRELMLDNLPVFYITFEKIKEVNENKELLQSRSKRSETNFMSIYKDKCNEKKIGLLSILNNCEKRFLTMFNENKLYYNKSFDNSIDEFIKELNKQNIIRISGEPNIENPDKNLFISFTYFIPDSFPIESKYKWINKDEDKKMRTAIYNSPGDSNTIIFRYMPNIYNSFKCLNIANCDSKKRELNSDDQSDSKKGKNNTYMHKYLKYKNKYLKLKNQLANKLYGITLTYLYDDNNKIGNLI